MIFAILAYERPAYLHLMLRNLSALVAPTDKIIVYDDGSETPDMLDYLNGDSEFALRNPVVWPDHPDILDRIGPMPDVHSLVPISTSFPFVHVQINPHRGIMQSAMSIQHDIFGTSEEPYCMMMEADTVLRRDALPRLRLEMASMDLRKTAIISLMNISYYPHYNETIGTTAQAWLVTRAYYDACEKLDLRSQTWQGVHRNSDVRRINFAKQFGLEWRLMRPAVAQHIGVDSIAWERKMEERNWLFDKTTERDQWFQDGF